MTQIVTAEAISRRKALTFFGLATAALAALSVVAVRGAAAQTVGWSAVMKEAPITTGARRGALAAQRGVKKGVSDYALARVRT